MNPATAKVSHALQGIAAAIDAELLSIAGERMAFTLIVFTPDRAQYISNGPTDQCLQAIKKLIEFNEAGMPDIPAHRYNG